MMDYEDDETVEMAKVPSLKTSFYVFAGVLVALVIGVFVMASMDSGVEDQQKARQDYCESSEKRGFDVC